MTSAADDPSVSQSIFTVTEKAPKNNKSLFLLFIQPRIDSRKHAEMHVYRRKLSLKFTGYCRQTSYTDSAVVFTLLPAVAWVLKSQFAPVYMHFNICFKGVSGKI